MLKSSIPLVFIFVIWESFSFFLSKEDNLTLFTSKQRGSGKEIGSCCRVKDCIGRNFLNEELSFAVYSFRYVASIWVTLSLIDSLTNVTIRMSRHRDLNYWTSLYSPSIKRDARVTLLPSPPPDTP